MHTLPFNLVPGVARYCTHTHTFPPSMLQTKLGLAVTPLQHVPFPLRSLGGPAVLSRGDGSSKFAAGPAKPFASAEQSAWGVGAMC